MREEIVGLPQDIPSEAWWIRVMDDDLTGEEQEQWREHLAGCARCQREWAAFAAADAALRLAAPPPPLPAPFTASTVARIVRKQRLHRLATFAAGTLITVLVTLIVVTYLGSTYAALERSIGAVLSARQIVFRSLVQTLVGLLLSWKAVLPYVVAATLALYLVLMPHSVAVTATLLWLSRRRQHAVAATAVGA